MDGSDDNTQTTDTSYSNDDSRWMYECPEEKKKEGSGEGSGGAGCGCGSWGTWTNSITLEPVLFIHNLCSQVVWIASQDLMTEKACTVNLHESTDVCSDLTHHDHEEVATQDLVSELMTYRTVLETSIKVVWILVLGGWSDQCGRRLPLLISLLGLLGEAGIHLLMSQQPAWPLETMLFASLPYSLSGGTHALLMLCFAYMADKSKPRRRTVRMGLLDAAYYLGSPVGSAVAGPVLDAGGYIGAFTLVMALYLVAMVYVALRLRHSDHQRQSDTTEEDTGCGKCNVDGLYTSVKVTVQSRPNRATHHILLLILAMLCDSLPVWGEGTVKYLFTQRVLDWTHTEYSHWATFASLSSVCVMVVVVPIVSMKAGVRDGWLGVTGGAARTISSVIYYFVTSPDLAWLMWTGAVVASGKNMAPVAIRSIISQLAGSQHTGEVFAVMAMTECLVSLAGAPLYNAVYTATLESHPATFYLISAAFNLFLTLLILGVTVSMKKVTRDGTVEGAPATSIT